MKTRSLFLFLCLLCISCLPAFGENINGSVWDETTQEPIIGASVMIEGTTTGTITDLDGNFNLNVSLNDKLVISYMGYTTQTITVSSFQPVIIHLSEEKQELDELVVIGYGVQKKSDITGAISSVSSEDISSALASNPMQALQGRASGVQIVQNSGAPGSKTTIKIRGTGTVNDSDPLYVVDGFIVDDIEYLNPNDIESMEILKDAASSSIYGARSANGVVLITTKQGESGKTKIVFDSYAGISSPWKKIDVMGVEDFALMRDYVEDREIYSVDGQLYYSKDPEGNLYFDDYKYHLLDTIMSNPDNPDNWWDAITQTGIKQHYNLSVSGGNDKHKYLVSGSYYDERGIVKTSDYQRFSLRMNLNNKLAKWLDLRTSLLYTNDERNIVPEGNNSVLKRALSQNPLIHTYNTAGYYSEDHPIAMIERNHNTTTNHRIDANIDLTARLGKLFTYQFKFSNSANFFNRNRFFEVNKREEAFIMPTDLTKVARTHNMTNKTEINNLLTFNYNKHNHNIGVTLGQTAEMYKLTDLYAERQGAASNSSNLWYLDAAYYGDRATGGLNEWTALGLLSRVNYSYKDRYLLQVNFRADASSKFSSQERWGYFPSASIGWKFTGEEWMQDQQVLSLGKIRAGWGLLGNNRIDEYARYTVINNEYNYSYGNGSHVTQSGAAASTLGNENIRWEKTESYNIGLDLNFFNNRLSTSIEYFNKETSDMLLRVPVSLSVGLGNSPMVNAGAVNNKGFEFSANYKGGRSKFKYEIGFNLSYIKNKVTSLGQGNEPIYGALLNESSLNDYVTKTEVGMPIAYFYGYVTDGIFQTVEEVEKSAQNDGKTEPGDFKFKDLNNDGKIDASDRTYLGSPHPDFVFGLPVNLSYGNFDLYLFFQGQYGNELFNTMDYYLYSTHGTGNVYADLRSKHWSVDNPNGTIPDLAQADRPRNFRASDLYIQDGSYLRLKNVTFTYNLPADFLKKIHFANASIYLSAQNLLTFTKYDGFDPEVGKQSGEESNNLYMGVDTGNYPQARSLIFGLKVTL